MQMNYFPHQFKSPPCVTNTIDLEKDQLRGSEGIDVLQWNRGYSRSDKCSPDDVRIACKGIKFLESKKYTT